MRRPEIERISSKTMWILYFYINSLGVCIL
jgi:hypothetical protein